MFVPGTTSGNTISLTGTFNLATELRSFDRDLLKRYGVKTDLLPFQRFIALMRPASARRRLLESWIIPQWIEH
jgi:hypothetical protein